MNILRYLFLQKRTIIYFALSVILTIILSLLTSDTFRFELLIIFFLLMLLMRIADDQYDYAFDAQKGKNQELTERCLLILYLVNSVIFITIHICIFGAWGLISVLFILYIQLEERVQILQKLFMFLLSCCYCFLLNGYIDFHSPAIIVWLIISLIFPILFAIYKRRKRR